MQRAGRHLAAWSCAAVGGFWLFLLLAGDWNRGELVAAACAGTLAATAALAVRLTRPAAVVPLRLLAGSASVPLLVIADFFLVMWLLLVSLATRRVHRGSFVTRPFPSPRGARGRGARAWAGLAATWSPNAYVVDFDLDSSRARLHDLLPRRRSESPV